MLKPTQMQEIQDLKLRGYAENEIAPYFEEHGQKPPSQPTIRKYYEMDILPEIPNENLIKDKAFDHTPFREFIIAVVKNNYDCCVSSIYDVLTEKFVEEGDFDFLPGNEQTLRNYVHYLKDSKIVDNTPENRRIYDRVFDTPPGEQMLIDFGEQKVENNLTVHFICLLLRYSRMFCVFAQDHKFNAEEACRAIYRSFCKFGGRPKVLVIDQDAVFVHSETYGEVIETETFREFCTEQDLKLWVCHKADPESKGPIENTVGFVKKNYFSARTITCMDDVFRTLPAWVERKSRRIHRTTFCIPLEIYNHFEKEALAQRPTLPSFYENSPSSYESAKIESSPFMQFRSCHYSLPRACCFSEIRYKAIGNKLYIYDADLKHICTHTITECKGTTVRLPEHNKEPSTDWISITEDMRIKWNCTSFQHFINGFKKENPRHLSAQLGAVKRFLDAEKPERQLVSQVMDECCKNYRYRYSQFKAVYELAKAGKKTTPLIEFTDVQCQDMNVYRKAFADRCAQ
jgi:hypothetical protein